MNSSQKQFLIWIRPFLRSSAIRITQSIARRYGKRIGFVYVCGYPKSGTTWISHMVAHCLDIPYVDPYYVPLTFKGLIHNHWDYHPSLDQSIYVIRDGRDVIVSEYMNLMKNYVARRETYFNVKSLSPTRRLVENVGQIASLEKRFRRLFGPNFDPWDVRGHLPKFIEAEFEKPFISSVKKPWSEHIRSWQSNAKNTVFVKYEDMLECGVNTLSNVLSNFLETEVDQKVVEYTIWRYAFDRKTGRAAGDEDRSSFARKGIKGDWRNYFSKQACQVFDQFTGDLIIDLGYESSHTWINQIS